MNSKKKMKIKKKQHIDQNSKPKLTPDSGASSTQNPKQHNPRSGSDYSSQNEPQRLQTKPGIHDSMSFNKDQTPNTCNSGELPYVKSIRKSLKSNIESVKNSKTNTTQKTNKHNEGVEFNPKDQNTVIDPRNQSVKQTENLSNDEQLGSSSDCDIIPTNRSSERMTQHQTLLVSKDYPSGSSIDSITNYTNKRCGKVTSPDGKITRNEGAAKIPSSAKTQYNPKRKKPDAVDRRNKGPISTYHKDVKPPSLKNLGVTCYLNSALQGISACDTFVREISDLCMDGGNHDVKELHVFKALLDVLNKCSTGQQEISRNAIFRQWNKSGQQDCYELLAYALNQVYNELRKNKEASNGIPCRDLQRWLQVKLPMRFIIQYQIICECGAKSLSPLQSDLALHVTIPKTTKHLKLDDLIDHYFDEGSIENFECNIIQCKKSKAKRIARFSRPLPKTLCIHLQRTHWNGHNLSKVDKPIAFETSITMSSKYWCATSEATENSDSKSIDREQSDGDEKYSLVSVIVHSGTVNGGHYICYKKVNEQWFLTNDSYVKTVSLSVVLNSQAYVLFYEQPYNN